MASGNEVLIEDARIIFLNFAGKKQKFNDEGDRNFCVLLSPEMADDLSRDGWNVKTTTEREDADGDMRGGDPYLKVSVQFQNFPPTVVLVTSRGRTHLDEATVGMIDDADIKLVDLIITPYDWTVNEKTGRKAYLKKIFVTIHEDELDLKYGDIPISGTKPAGE